MHDARVYLNILPKYWGIYKLYISPTSVSHPVEKIVTFCYKNPILYKKKDKGARYLN